MPDLKSGQRNKRKKNSGKSFLILPVMFFFVIYLGLYAMLAPNFSSLVSVAGLFFTDDEKTFSEEYRDIFEPLPEDDSVPKLDDKNDKNDKNNKNPNNKTDNATVSIETITYPSYSDRFGELIIDDCSIDAPLFMGDGNVALRYGVGIYYGSNIPGAGGTILVAGHNNTYFNGLKNAEVGQVVEIRTSYGNYYYQITDIQIKKATDPTAFDLSANYENLVMYTCYPFNQLGITSNRCFVYASLISGPEIVDENNNVDNSDVQTNTAPTIENNPTVPNSSTEEMTEAATENIQSTEIEDSTQLMTEVVTDGITNNDDNQREVE